jgi:ATP-dependent exoDNAse (exonuclease V) beta subunit
MYPERLLPHPFYIDQSEGDERECYVLRINQGLAEKNAELRRIYEEAKLRESVNRLNTFYVALTRARQELYFIGVKKKYGGRYPFDLLERISDLQAGQLLRPDKPRVEKAAPPQPGWEVALLRWPVAPALQVGERAEFHPAALRRGKFLHEVLAEIEWVAADPQAAVQQALARLNYRPEKLSPLELEIVEKLPTFLSRPPLREYFLPRPGRRVWREKEFCDEEGHLFRLDRVVVDPERVMVIDFKSGAGQSEPPSARETVKRQMAKYLSIVGQLFPEKRGEALVVYFDDGFWEVYR